MGRTLALYQEYLSLKLGLVCLDPQGPQDHLVPRGPQDHLVPQDPQDLLVPKGPLVRLDYKVCLESNLLILTVGGEITDGLKFQINALRAEKDGLQREIETLKS